MQAVLSAGPRTLHLKPDQLGMQEFNIEKLQLLEAEKGKIKKEYERREGQIDVKKKMYALARHACMAAC